MLVVDSENSNILNYYYPLEDIAREVEMRTSYLGRFRKTPESAHLLDMLAFTRDERDLFISFLKSGAALIFPKLSKLTKNLTDAYHVLDETTGTYANSVHYKVEWEDNLNPNYKVPLDQRILDCLTWYIIWRWLMYALPQNDDQTSASGYSGALDDIEDYTGKLLNPVINKIPRVF